MGGLVNNGTAATWNGHCSEYKVYRLIVQRDLIQYTSKNAFFFALPDNIVSLSCGILK